MSTQPSPKPDGGGSERVGVIVLGMHRSGTSAFARVLNLLGASLPRNVMGAAASNEGGHWEPERLVDLNDRLLKEGGSGWDDWQPFSPDDIGPARLQEFKDELRTVISEEYDGASLFVLKDPRICRFVPLYQEVFSELGIEDRYILPIRNPLAVMDSLAKRDDMSSGHAGLLWLRHALDSEKWTRELPRTFVSYERLLENWEETVEEFTAALGLRWPRGIEAARSDINENLDPGLRHHIRTEQELEESEDASGWMKTVHRARRRLVTDPDSREALADLDRVSEEFDAVAPVFGKAFVEELAVREKRQSDHIHAYFGGLLRERDGEIHRLTVGLENTEKGLQETQSTISRQEEGMAAQRREIASQQELMVSQQKEIAQQEEEIALLETRATSPTIGERVRPVVSSIVERLGGAINLKPVQAVEAIQSRRSATIWRLEGPESLFELDGAAARDLPSGHYEFAIDFPDGHERIRRPKLLVDSGSGFEDPQMIDFGFSHDGSTHYVAKIALRQGARSIRFAPSVVPCEVSFGRARWRRLPADDGSPVDPTSQSLSRRLLQLARRGRSSIQRGTAYLGRSADLVPVNHLRGVNLGKKVTTWRMTGHDPAFHLDGVRPRPRPPGRYLVTLQLEQGHEDLVSPSLFLDTSGRGFAGEGLVDLEFFPISRGRIAAHFRLEHHVRRLRFDPAVMPGRITLGPVRIRRLNRLQYYGSLAWRDVVRRRNVGDSWLHAASETLKPLFRGNPRKLAKELRELERPKSDYESWLEAHDTLGEAEVGHLLERLEGLDTHPLISVVMPVHNTPEDLLRAAIDSVRNQLYANWELCIADDHSTNPHIERILSEYVDLDPRIQFVRRDQNGHICHATNSAFELVNGDWVALLDHDDELRPHALAEVVLEVDRYPGAQIVYSDEDKIDEQGRRFDPYFKPDYSRELFRSQNYFNHLTVHRADNVRAVGGWRPGFEGAQDYDLNLRIVERIEPEAIRHIPKVLYHWRVVEGSTALAGEEKGYAYDAGLRALQEHAMRMGLDAKVEEAFDSPYYRMRFSTPTPAPLVSLIIPTRDQVDLLQGCVESISKKTTYPNYELIVVDNGSVEQETLEYLDTISAHPNTRVLRYTKPFNFSAINNFAVREANGTLVGLVNNDIEVISPDWLTEMVSWAAQEEVGCVGAKLYYGNDTIQHAGVILGIGGVAGHSHKYFPRDHSGYFCRLKITQNLSAVTAACLLVKKEVYEEVGGLNEEDLTIAFNDVDFCLKVRDAGYSNVWTPHAELYHLESVSRGAEDNPEKQARFRAEVLYMLKKWDSVLADDPYYSPNLTREHEDFTLRLKR